MTILNYDVRPRRSFHWKRWLIATLLLFPFHWLLAWVFTYPYVVYVHQVCQECGTRRIDRHWLNMNIWVTHIDYDTPMSTALLHAGLPPHTHRFEFMSTGGQCLLGSAFCGVGGKGRQILSIAHNPLPVSFIAALYRDGQTAEADRWRTRLLDASTTDAAFSDLVMMDLPPDGFESHADYLNWKHKHIP
jgi:hypothetical protein